MGEITNVTVHILLFISLYFEVFLLITFIELYFQKESYKPENLRRYPSVSIIVPCFNEEKTVEKTIRSILDLDYPKHKLEILVVDDGSTDNTWKLLQRYKNHGRIKLFKKTNGGKYTALNLALHHTSAELVGCLDADSFVAPDALTEIVRHFENKKVMAVTPAIKIHKPKSVIQLIQKAEYMLAIFIRRTFASLDAVFIAPGPFSIFKRSVFTQIGPYRKAYNTEDLEIALRMQKHHLKIENAYTAHVYTNAPKTLRALYNQRLRWAYGFLKNISDYRFMIFNKNFGNLGILVLPTAILLIFATLYFIALLIGTSAQSVLAKLVEIQTIGLYNLGNFQFDLFFVNTHSVLFLIYILTILTFILILIGKRLVGEKKIFSLDMLYYLFLYGFLAPLWLSRAVVNVALSRPTDWTKEK